MLVGLGNYYLGYLPVYFFPINVDPSFFQEKDKTQRDQFIDCDTESTPCDR